MKRTISIIVTTIVIWALIAYCIYLLTQWAITTTPDMIGSEMIVAIWLCILLAVIWYFSTFGAHYLNKPKIILGLWWLLIILCWAYLLVDPVSTSIYLSDVTRIVWVYLLVAAVSWFIGVWADLVSSSGSPRVKDAEIIEI